MRDDFQYNLKLLEARDKEIIRLEALFGEKLKELMMSEGERKQLMDIISSLGYYYYYHYDDKNNNNDNYNYYYDNYYYYNYYYDNYYYYNYYYCNYYYYYYYK